MESSSSTDIYQHLRSIKQIEYLRRNPVEVATGYKPLCMITPESDTILSPEQLATALADSSGEAG